MVDAGGLNPPGPEGPCGFESRPGYVSGFRRVWRRVPGRHASILQHLESWQVDNFACFIMETASGSADIFGDDRKIFKWASVSKLASTLAVLSAVTEGVLTLDAELPNGSILSDVLAHASGLGQEIDTSLGIFEQKVVIKPRTKRIYSNAGFELLAANLERESGFEFSDYLHEVLFSVAAMDGASVSGELWPHAGRTGAAAGVSGSIRDLLGLAQAVVWGTPFVDADLLEQAKLPYISDLPGILPGFGEMRRNYWGLGIEVRGDKSPHWTSKRNSPATYGHFGAAGTFLWVDPVQGLSVGVLTDRAFGPWAQRAWPEFSSVVLDAFR